ncbi:GIY-YIG nuclease family protein [Microbaculum marinum]|uniref:GIY-YIG nuclease family protein n=1 Tax=Microbaculum marinum TaxID=1764581 RepID=A0AAW9RW48_9HYPH
MEIASAIASNHEGGSHVKPVFVYILRCADGSYYTGTTRTSLERRVAEHNQGTYGGYTKSRRPVTLVFAEEFPRADDAIAAERQIKGWSRAKKEALISSDFERLRELALRRG